jgi:glutathione S-transferase
MALPKPLTIYGSLHDRGYRIAWACEELNVAYTLHPIDLSKGEHQTAAYRAIHPYQKVPALKTGDRIITESGAILHHLATHYQDHAVLIPQASTPARDQYEQWMYFGFTELEPPLWTKAKHAFVYPPDSRVPAIKNIVEKEYEKACAFLGHHLKDTGAYALGEHFQMVDVCLGYLLSWGIKAKMPQLPEALNQYHQRIQKRPAVQKLNALAQQATT